VEATEWACHAANDAFDALVVAPTTTRPALLAKLAYFQELSADHETEWMIDERVCPSALIDSIVESLQNIGGLA